VKIQGTLYPAAAGGKRDTVVMLLHTFDLKKGGSRQESGWTDLAASLQADGYTVLGFDFRGFGGSKTVEKEFWSFPHNGLGYIKRRTAKPPETIDHKDFNNAYLRYLVNDIAAAKAYLDRRNDAKELNSSNVVVIGASEGATLGAMWMANEARRKRETTMPPAMFAGAAVLAQQTEINDVACGVWLTISPKLGTSPARVSKWLTEAGKTNKVPMAFFYAKQDSTSGGFAKELVASIKKSPKSKDFQTTGSYAIDGTKLKGNDLLDNGLETQALLKKYLESVLEARGAREQKDRKIELSQYWYINPSTGRAAMISKKAGAEAPEVNVRLIWPQ
jgi:hypothetical protein